MFHDYTHILQVFLKNIQHNLQLFHSNLQLFNTFRHGGPICVPLKFNP